MRIRIRDMLLLTTLVTIYLTAFVNVLEEETQFLVGKPFLLYGVVVSSIGMISDFVRRDWLLKKEGPIIAELTISLPWLALFTRATIVLAIAMLLNNSIAVLVVCCSAFHFGTITYTILHPTVFVVSKGLVYLANLHSWSGISPISDAEGNLTHLQIGAWWGRRVTAEVPRESQNNIQIAWLKIHPKCYSESVMKNKINGRVSCQK